MRLIPSFLLAAALAGCSAASAPSEPPALSEPPTLSTDGFGDVKIGMTSAALKKEFGATLDYDSDPANPDTCAIYVLPKSPELALMVVEGTLARIDVSDAKADLTTDKGGRIGMTTAQIRKLYGKGLVAEPHKYNEAGQYLTAQSADGSKGVVFETDKDKVTTLRVGRWDEVQWVEGCS